MHDQLKHTTHIIPIKCDVCMNDIDWGKEYILNTPCHYSPVVINSETNKSTDY